MIKLTRLFFDLCGLFGLGEQTETHNVLGSNSELVSLSFLQSTDGDAEALHRGVGVPDHLLLLLLVLILILILFWLWGRRRWRGCPLFSFSNLSFGNL